MQNQTVVVLFYLTNTKFKYNSHNITFHLFDLKEKKKSVESLMLGQTCFFIVVLFRFLPRYIGA